MTLLLTFSCLCFYYFLGNIEHEENQNAFLSEKEEKSIHEDPYTFLSLDENMYYEQVPSMAHKLYIYTPMQRPDRSHENIYLKLPQNEYLDLVFHENRTKLDLHYCEESGSLTPVSTSIKRNLQMEIFIKDEQFHAKVRSCDSQGLLLKGKQYTEEILLPREKQCMKAVYMDKEPINAAYFLRKHVKWYGCDLFAQVHIHEENAQEEKIIFQDPQGKNYEQELALFDYLYYDKGCWQKLHRLNEGTKFHNLPLLQLVEKKRDVLKFILFEGNGPAHTELHLCRSKEPWSAHHILSSCKVHLRKNYKKASLHYKEHKITMQSKDWLLFEEDTVSKISSYDELKAYLEGTKNAALWVCDDLFIEEQKVILQGHLFSPYKNECVYFNFTNDGQFQVFDAKVQDTMEN